MIVQGSAGRMGRREALQALCLLLAASSAPAFAQARPLRIGIIGTGRVGGALATHWTKAGHEVLMSSRHSEELRPLATSLGALARVGRPKEAAAFGEVVLVSVPYSAMPEIGRDNAGAAQRARWCSTPATRSKGATGRWRLPPQKKGAGVATAEFLPGTRVVRAFNCIPAASLANNANRKPERIAIPIGGDDAQALADCRTPRARRRVRPGGGGLAGADAAVRSGRAAGQPAVHGGGNAEGDRPVIRDEAAGDAPAVRVVNEEAFGSPLEAGIVDALRADCADRAVARGRARRRHRRAHPVHAGRDRRPPKGRFAATVSRRWRCARRGSGRASARRSSPRAPGVCARPARPFVIVLGHPEYYPRFGFEPASRHGVRCQWPDVPDEAFMLLVLDPASWRRAWPAGDATAPSSTPAESPHPAHGTMRTRMASRLTSRHCTACARPSSPPSAAATSASLPPRSTTTRW